MTVTGIIAECNPFHEGHAYLIRRAREITGADYIVAAVSTDYVQRGLPAVFCWEDRVRALLAEGVDLVVGLPLYVSCSGADYFCRGAVRLLESTGAVTDIVFGSESGDLAKIQEYALSLPSRGGHDPAFRDAVRGAYRSGGTFADALSAAGGDIPKTPNDLLGAHYLRALAETGSGIRPHAVRRIDCPSAGQRREALKDCPPKDQRVLFPDDLSGALLHALCAETDYSAFLDVSVDLSNRIRNLLPRYTTYTEFASLLKTRNVTYTGVCRALLHILLGMRQETMARFDRDFGLCGWIRPLGMRRDAAPLLHKIKRAADVPFLDRLSTADQTLSPDLYAYLEEELRAELLYDLSLKAGAVPAPSKPLIIV